MSLLTLSVLVVILGVCQAAWNVTCDFDLENIVEIINYLPIECQQIYKAGATSEIYKASLGESNKFQEFSSKLAAFEGKESPTQVDEIPKQNTKLRFDIYSVVMLTDCAETISKINDSLTDEEKSKQYYNCLLTKRDQMIMLIPK